MGIHESEEKGSGNRIPDHTRQLILERFDHYRRQGLPLMQAYTAVGAEVGRDARVVGAFVNRMRPTVGAARMYLRSKALKLAKRLVAKANTPEILDILSRPSMGVIDPAVKSGGEGMGFQLLVSADSCGAVKVGLQAGSMVSQDEPVAAFDPYALQAGEVDGETTVPQRKTVWGRSQNVQQALEAARIRLRNARAERSQEDAGVQVLDVQPEESDTAKRQRKLLKSWGVEV